MRNCLQEPREQKYKELQITQQQTGLERDWQGANVQITGASNAITETRKTQNEKLRLLPTNTWALPHENIYEKNKKRRGWRNFELNQFYSKGTDKGKCAWVYQVLVRLNPLLFRERAKLRRYTLTQLLEKQRKFHICTFDHKISHYVGWKMRTFTCAQSERLEHVSSCRLCDSRNDRSSHWATQALWKLGLGLSKDFFLTCYSHFQILKKKYKSVFSGEWTSQCLWLFSQLTASFNYLTSIDPRGCESLHLAQSAWI